MTARNRLTSGESAALFDRPMPSSRAIQPLIDLLRERIDARPPSHMHRQPAAGLIAGAHPVPDVL